MKKASKKSLFQYVATVIANGLPLAYGLSLGWMSPAHTEITRDEEDGQCVHFFCIDDTEASWVATALIIGAFVSGLFAGPAMSKFGRKGAMIMYFIFSLSGWFLLTFATEPLFLYIGRFMNGLGSGGGLATVPVYIGEISSAKIRGRLIGFVQVHIAFGILISYVLGYIYKLYTQTLLSTILLCFYGVALFFVPESPSFQISKNKIDKAEKSLKWLRGKNFDTATEIAEILEFHKTEEVSGLKAFINERANRRALLIMFALFTVYELCGENGVVLYAGRIFEDADIGVHADLATIFIGVTTCFGTITSLFLIDKFGRRMMIYLAYGCMFFSFIVLGIYFQLKQDRPELVENLKFLPVFLLCFFIFMSSVGCAPVTWVVLGEIFAQSVKDVAAAVTMCYDFAMCAILALLFPYLSRNIGLQGTFFFFSGFSALGLLCGIFVVPETKGKTFREIQDMLFSKK